mmetsp:Transcript_39934/g.90102  ORF Transcript_39934/g.90102 Transcript_39934/m.90102 type:complete len:399 (-) Transcript_39934:48-1244(-)
MSAYAGILGVKKDATAIEVRRAFMVLAKVHHPDKSSDPDAAAKFRRIHEAYEALLRTCPKSAPASTRDPSSASGTKPTIPTCTDCGRPSPDGRFGVGITQELWFCGSCFHFEEKLNKESEDWFSQVRTELLARKKGKGKGKGKGKMGGKWSWREEVEAEAISKAAGDGEGESENEAPQPVVERPRELTREEKRQLAAERKRKLTDQNELAKRIMLMRRVEAAAAQEPGSPVGSPATGSSAKPAEASPPAAEAATDDPGMIWLHSGAAGLAKAGWAHHESKSRPGSFYFFRAAKEESIPEATDAIAEELVRIWGESGAEGFAERGWERRESRRVPGAYYFFHPESGRSVVAPAPASPAPATPPSLRLPDGWERVESRSRPGSFYYYNAQTGATQMDRPG